jgi:ribonuclease VapC
MVIDTSAMVAILLAEPEAPTFARAIAEDHNCLISAFSVLECAVVVAARKGPTAARELDLLLHRAGISTVPVDADQAELARAAYERFGKGRHPAGLNLGDCCAYALARKTGDALLFKGSDFSETDTVAGIPGPA